LVAGTCFAESGNDVVCLDVDEQKIERLRAGEIPIYEPGLSEVLRRNVSDGRLSFSTEYSEAIPGVDVAFIAVGTPPGEDGKADLQYVLSAARSIAEHMTGHVVVVDKSTVPVGTARKVMAVIKEGTDHTFDVVSNPEFLKEGTAIDDFLKPDRVVIGAETSRAAETMMRLYSPFVRTGNPILEMDIESAEITKYAANAMLATRISFMNEVANMCDRVGANIDAVRKGIGTDARIGSRFLFAGCGYGGSCFPKDVKAIIQTAAEHDYDFRTLRAVEEVNERQKLVLVERVKEHYGSLAGKRFAIWGLAFKPGTDDMREAPAVIMANALMDAGASICAYDPEAMEMSRAHYLGDKIDYAQRPIKALEGADGLLLLTEWNEFRNPDFNAVKAALREPVLFDGRNIWQRDLLEKQGFTYYGIGR